jgi:F0F1-type ATP synthase assembly protein I
MTANNRLLVIAGLIVLSAGYAVLVKKDPAVASAIAAGYVALLLTAIFVLNVWKKP